MIPPGKGANADGRPVRVRPAVKGLSVRATSTSEGLLVPLPDWFLSTQERGNPDSSIPTWCAGNTAEPLIHGKGYFDRLAAEGEALLALLVADLGATLGRLAGEGAPA